MGTRIVNTNPTGEGREIHETGEWVEFGQEVEVDTDLAERLLEQTAVWQRPTSNKAKAAEGKGA